MNKSITSLAAFSLLLASSLLQASPVAAVVTAVTTGTRAASDHAALQRYTKELDGIKQSQQESLLLKQQLEAEKLRADLTKQRGDQVRSGMPYVQALTGAGKQRKARLVVSGVGEVTVLPGDRLPGGWQVLTISDQAVTARKPDGSRVTLPFYGH